MSRKQNSVIFIPVAAYDLGISGIGGRGVWKGQGRVGEQGDANRPHGFIDRGTCKIRGAHSCDKQYRRVLPGGRTCDGRLDERAGRGDEDLTFCKAVSGCISYNDRALGLTRVVVGSSPTRAV